MTDIDYWDGELIKKLDELEEAIKGLKGAYASGKEEVSWVGLPDSTGDGDDDGWSLGPIGMN